MHRELTGFLRKKTAMCTTLLSVNSSSCMARLAPAKEGCSLTRADTDMNLLTCRLVHSLAKCYHTQPTYSRRQLQRCVIYSACPKPYMHGGCVCYIVPSSLRMSTIISLSHRNPTSGASACGAPCCIACAPLGEAPTFTTHSMISQVCASVCAEAPCLGYAFAR